MVTDVRTRLARTGPRQIKRLEDESITSEATFGVITITPAQEPLTIDVGQTRSFQYDIFGNENPPILDPDHCFFGIWDGYAVDIEATANGETIASESDVCVDATAPFHDVDPHAFVFELEGTTPGAVDVRVSVSGHESGSLLMDHEATITIEDPDSNGDNGGNGGNGGGGVDPGDPPQNGDDGDDGDESLFDQARTLLILLAVIAGLFFASGAT